MYESRAKKIVCDEGNNEQKERCIQYKVDVTGKDINPSLMGAKVATLLATGS